MSTLKNERSPFYYIECLFNQSPYSVSTKLTVNIAEFFEGKEIGRMFRALEAIRSGPIHRDTPTGGGGIGKVSSVQTLRFKASHQIGILAGQQRGGRKGAIQLLLVLLLKLEAARDKASEMHTSSISWRVYQSRLWGDGCEKVTGSIVRQVERGCDRRWVFFKSSWARRDGKRRLLGCFRV